MRVTNGSADQRELFKPDDDIHTSMRLLSGALNEHIQKHRSSEGVHKTKFLFHQLVDFMLASWSTFFVPGKSSKYKKIFQRALGIQPQLAQLDEESFDIDRHQHDLECLARMASSIKREDIVQEIRMLLPHQPPIPNATAINLSRKEGWVKLEEEGKHHYEMKEWKLALVLFSQAIGLNSEEGILYSCRAMCELHLSKFQLAVEDAQDAVELDPKCAEYRRLLSEASSGSLPCQPIKSKLIDFYQVGRNYFYGDNGFVEDHVEAEKNLKMAAATFHVKPSLLLAKLLLKNERSCEAFPFLQRAAEKGVVEAQYLFGRLLIYGDGCPRHEPAAKKWFFKAHAQGFVPKSIKNVRWVDEIVKHAESLVRFESDNNIDSKGISLAKRLSRFTSHTSFEFDGFDELLKSAIQFNTSHPTKETILMKPAIEVWMPMMMKRAQNRSFKAQSFFLAHGLIMEAQKLLLRNQTVQSLKMLREDAAEEMLKNNQANAEAYHVLICSDRSSSIENKLWLAIQCVKLDPSVPDFHHSLARVYGDMGDYRRAVRSIDVALKKLAHSDWLYDRAHLLRLSKVKPDLEVVSAFEKYVSCSPPDAAHVPDAYYCIALAHYAMSRLKEFTVALKKGKKAESSEIRLPCFRAVKKNDYVTKQIPKHNVKPNSRTNGKKTEKIFEILCVVCSKGNPLLFCPFCHNWTCGKDEQNMTAGMHDCQASHIAYHKSVASASTGNF
ncbi:putative Stress-induced-phosphoprotein 1/sw [Daphnia magna]|uniref:Putative Stress-induced-phosphoprotein 1/sw n=1 Tax=Daphnia magna TaxID=35525 RepID=A0A164PHK5_9CRUS|nr:putative Stress-induced-phosphoprotein 1/sw [Daphnia magna]